MYGFHIDLNVGQFTGPYLRQWLAKLADIGYDTIVWEVENAVQWTTCPECVAPEAFTKDEFRELLTLCRDLGLESIPLFQTLAHCEYVLRHDAYQHLAEIPGKVDQYCPRNPDLVPFLARWIDEYLDLFGDVRYFHLGDDESWWLASCDTCKAFVAQHGYSRLFIDHVNALAGPLIERGFTPIIWADMVLHHHEALDTLSREFLLFDWMYDIHNDCGKAIVWGKGLRRPGEFDAADLDTFGHYLFPDGPEGRLEPFYCADFLADKGFKVVTCPASSSSGDTVFTPRTRFHMLNTFDSFGKGRAGHLHGSVLTSWTVRIHPWELQEPIIQLPGYLAKHPDASLDDFLADFTRERFGAEQAEFWQACELLAPCCPFAEARTLGFHKNVVPAAPDCIASIIRDWLANGKIAEELTSCRDRLVGYEQGVAMLTALAGRASKGHDLLDAWTLAGQNLVNRARGAIALLEHADSVVAGEALSGDAAQSVKAVLDEMRGLRTRTETFYRRTLEPTRCKHIMHWLYDAVDAALSRLSG